MYNRILVAIDISNSSQKVLAQALSVAKKYGAEILLLHILTSEEENSPQPIPPDITSIYPAQGNDLTLMTWQEQWEIYKEKARELLDDYGQEAAKVGVKATVEQFLGRPGKSICDRAQTWQADLIVVGRRGRSGIQEMLIGSVSNHVLHHAPCSVLIVQ